MYRPAASTCNTPPHKYPKLAFCAEGCRAVKGSKDFTAYTVAGLYYRVAKLKAAFGSAEDKQAWTSSPDQRAHYYRVTETLLQNSGATGKHSVGNSPSFADAVLFSVLWDDVALFGEDKTLVEASPKLQSFYQ